MYIQIFFLLSNNIRLLFRYINYTYMIEFDVVSKIDEHNEVEYADGITLRKYEG